MGPLWRPNFKFCLEPEHFLTMCIVFFIYTPLKVVTTTRISILNESITDVYFIMVRLQFSVFVNNINNQTMVPLQQQHTHMYAECVLRIRICGV